MAFSILKDRALKKAMESAKMSYIKATKLSGLPASRVFLKRVSPVAAKPIWTRSLSRVQKVQKCIKRPA